MESEEALRYYLDEIKDTQNDINNVEVEIHIPNETEQATDFLHNAGLSDLTNLYQQGREITENVINASFRQRNLTEKQAQTIRSRVRTLNKTLINRQPRRKLRQDIRDVAWNTETSSTGTRSRSATPDSLDSGELLNEDLTSDDDIQPNSSPPVPLDHHQPKAKIKWTTSETLQTTKISRNDKGDVADLGSENVILKGYQALSENGTLPRHHRERSGSDPTTEIHLQPIKSDVVSETSRTKPTNLHNPLSHSHNNIAVDENNISTVSFETLIKKNENNEIKSVIIEKWDTDSEVNIDQLSDSEYQYLKPLLYVELVAIFDQYRIVNSNFKRKANKRRGGSVFGVNLSTLVMRDMPKPTDNCMVPEIFQSILMQLNKRSICEDGILRIAGQKQKLETLCNEIETKFFSNRKEIENALSLATTHELTGVLKKLLRDLPEPIFTMELFEMFYKAGAIPNVDDKVKALNLLVLLLPVEHRNTYRLLLEFLLNIIAHEKQNRMNLHNVAMITAPSFFPPGLIMRRESDKLIMKHLTKEELGKQINDAAVSCCIMETMLKAGSKLWSVPNFLVDQAREAQKKAQVKKDLGKDKEKNILSRKTKLVRSSTQYEPGAMNVPRIGKQFFI